MTHALLIAAFVLPALAGAALVNLLAPARIGCNARFDFALKAILGMGAGMGLASSIFFLLLFAGAAHFWPIVIIEAVLAAVLLIVTQRRRRGLAESPPIEAMPVKFRWLQILLAVLFALALWKSLASFGAVTQSRPHGEWDAWAIWNARARFLMTEQWREAFSPELAWSQIDYPLLLSAWNAQCWTWMYLETPLAPAFTALVFTFGTVLLLAASIGSLRSLSHGLLAGLLLLGCTNFSSTGSWQYADIPFSFYFLATMLLFALQDQLKELNAGLLVLAGIFGGMAAWTKNEGQALVVGAGFALLVLCAIQRGFKPALKAAACFGAGALPFMILAAIVKYHLSTSGNWLVGGSDIPLSVRLTTLDRYTTVANAMWNQTKEFAGFSGQIGRYLLIFYALVVGLRIERRALFPWLGLATLAIMIAAVFMVYVATPFELQWHIGTSITRLVCQWVPTGLFVYFMSLDTPENIKGAQTATEGSMTRM